MRCAVNLRGGFSLVAFVCFLSRPPSVDVLRENAYLTLVATDSKTEQVVGFLAMWAPSPSLPCLSRVVRGAPCAAAPACQADPAYRLFRPAERSCKEATHRDSSPAGDETDEKSEWLNIEMATLGCDPEQTWYIKVRASSLKIWQPATRLRGRSSVLGMGLGKAGAPPRTASSAPPPHRKVAWPLISMCPPANRRSTSAANTPGR